MTALVVLVAATAVYVERGWIGARLFVSYLWARGIPATVRFDRFDASGFSGSLRVGARRDPDLAVDRIEVAFQPGFLWRNGLAAPRIQSMRLVGVRLKARLAGHGLTFGAIQPLVDELASGPSKGPPPTVEIRRGVLSLTTPAGTVAAVGDAQIIAGRIASVEAHIAPADLRKGEIIAEVRSGAVSLRGEGRGLAGRASLELATLARGLARATNLAASADLHLASADLKSLDGPLTLVVAARAGELDGKGGRIVHPDLRLELRGSVTGGLARPELQGSATLSARADTVGAGGGSATSLAAALRIDDMRAAADAAGVRLAGAAVGALTAGRLGWGPGRLERIALDGSSPDLRLAVERSVWRVDGSMRSRGSAAHLAWRTGLGELAWGQVSATAVGQAAAASSGPSARLRLSADGRSGETAPATAQRIAASLPVVGAAPEARGVLAHALATAGFSARDIAFTLGDSGVRLTASSPLEIRAPGGRLAQIAPRDGPLLASEGKGFGGAASLRLTGPGLPQLTADVAHYRSVPSPRGWRTTASMSADLELDTAGVERGRVHATGQLVQAPGTFSFTAASCVTLEAASVRVGAWPEMTGLKGRICPERGTPMAASSPGGWNANAVMAGVSLGSPNAQARLEDVAGRIALFGGRAPLGGSMLVENARIIDAAPARRFLPLSASGRLEGASGAWRGSFGLKEAARGRPIGTVEISHDVARNAGGADISVQDLAFTPGGLQPADIFPMAVGLAREVQGQASFRGGLHWSGDHLTSDGRMQASAESFRSPAGKVKAARTEVRFTSLAPLISAPGQVAAAGSIDWLASVRDLRLVYAITPDAFQVTSGQAAFAGGRLIAGPTAIAFAGDHRTAGSLSFEGVDLGSLVASSSLADKVSVQARIGGDLQYLASAGGVRLSGGKVVAEGPGRLSIKRGALTESSAQSTDPAADPAQDFAYQALEDLAFDKMDAVIEPRPNGRLGMVFHINGRHDPAKDVQARIRIVDLLRGRAFKQTLPLPKGTPINLTLDTSLNFDELIHAYLQATAPSGSGAVQP